jgi:hypothetical protein
MMGRLKSDQGQLFYEFHLSNAVPEDHLVRKIDTAVTVRGEHRQCERRPPLTVMGMRFAASAS